MSISHCLGLVLHRHMSHSGNILNIYMCVSIYIYMCVFHVQYFHICLWIPFLLLWNRNSRNYCKVPIAYANATDLSGRISSILFSVSNLHHLWIIFYLLIWDLFFIKDLERNDINHANGQKDAIILMILQTMYIYIYRVTTTIKISNILFSNSSQQCWHTILQLFLPLPCRFLKHARPCSCILYIHIVT